MTSIGLGHACCLGCRTELRGVPPTRKAAICDCRAWVWTARGWCAGETRSVAVRAPADSGVELRLEALRKRAVRRASGPPRLDFEGPIFATRGEPIDARGIKRRRKRADP